MTPPGGGREWDAYYLDSRTAARQRARVRLMGTGLEIATESGATLWWPYAEVRQTQGFYRGEHVRLAHPSTEERIARLRALAAAPGPPPTPLLASEAWLELRAVCKSGV